MNTILEYLPFLLSGAKVTVAIFVLTLVLSLPLGLPFALGSESKILPIRWFCKIYIWIFRGTPLILQLYFFYYFFPISLGVKINPFLAVILTFVLNYAAERFIGAELQVLMRDSMRQQRRLVYQSLQL